MASRRDALAPLANFVLRVSGQPATLRYELHNISTGEKHRFTRADALAAFLRQHGIADDPQGQAGPAVNGKP